VASRKAPRTPKLLKSSESIALGAKGTRIVVVADTHSEPHPNAHRLIAQAKPDRILHAGDIGDLSVVRDLEKIAPTTPVRGNIDVRLPDLPDLVRLDVMREGERWFSLMLFHIAVAGPRLRGDAAKLARDEGATIVVCGHSHVPFIGRDRDLTIFNPGSIGPRRFHLPIVFGVMDITTERLSMKHVDCETGKDWMP
jgi:putative phosphoesterase